MRCRIANRRGAGGGNPDGRLGCFRPGGHSGTGFVTPDPAECVVEPRTTEELTAFVPLDDAAAPDVAAASPTSFVAPAGEPADADSVAGVTATATELFACYDANDVMRVFALFTDDDLQRAFVAEGMTGVAAGFLAATPVAREAVDRESVAMRDVRMRPDGRVGAFLVFRNPASEDLEATYDSIFVESVGRYLIDDVAFLDPGGARTPTP